MTDILVEACVDTVASAAAAEAGGAGRVELCANLVEGGTTPSAGTIATARERLRIPLFVIVRPRGGDFLHDAEELAVMRRDVAEARRLGADGVVVGALTPAGRVDAGAVRALLDAARALAVTFHRAFDAARHADEALDALVALGIDRVLTSGGAPTAPEGAAALGALVRRAAGRLTVLAGGGLTAANVGAVVAASGVREVHVRGAERVGSGMRYRRAGVGVSKPYVPDEFSRVVTDAARIAEVVAAVSGSAAGGRPGAPPTAR
ncbi:copper homeostasis protein CutC [Roseisolibacter sp. H3M3-2]|uniref:copper homeostasis protein CutC n=1 Tax=Roseisolibacter sp. H3M3-2 TaxID=3031323 RepID=UPI0023DAF1ED|nr:copper homeostasis protein CutC [Roseisolibacter sp. H3M3-2]MDF1503292.1 copper homeostasis protein CutC [Roseisolibacter sp. H3M3-2]